MSTTLTRCPHCGAYEDGTVSRRCMDCGGVFSIAVSEQKFYLERQLEFPKRCRVCRDARRKRNQQPWRAEGAQKE